MFKKCYQPAKPFIDCIFYSLHVPVVLLIMLWFRWMIQSVFFPSTDKWHFNIVWEIGSDSLDILKKGMENGSRVKRNCIGMHAIQLNLFYSLIVLGIVLFHSSKLWFVFFSLFLSLGVLHMKLISSRYTQVIWVLIYKNVDLVFTVVLWPSLHALIYLFEGLKLYSRHLMP